MRLTSGRPQGTRARRQLGVWDLGSLALGVPFGWLAAGPLHRLGPANVLLWTIAAMFIGKRKGAHIRKWLRLAGFGFVVAVATLRFDAAAAGWTQRTWVLVALGVGSALAAVPSGGLVHFWMSYTYRRRTARNTVSG